MATLLRSISAIVVGLAVTLALVVGVELLSSVVHPFPPDFGGTSEEVCRHVERYPTWVLAAVVPAWAGTALAGTWLAGWIGGRVCAVCIGLFLLAALVLNLSMLPYPIWFEVACLLAIGAAVAAGFYSSTRRRAAVQRVTL